MWHLFLRNTLNSWKPKLGNTQPTYIACWPTVCTTSSTQTERIIEFPLAKESWEYLLVFFINIIDFTLSDGKNGVECAETESWIRNMMFTLQCDSRQIKVETGKCSTNCWVTQQQLTHFICIKFFYLGNTIKSIFAEWLYYIHSGTPLQKCFKKLRLLLKRYAEWLSTFFESWILFNAVLYAGAS